MEIMLKWNLPHPGYLSQKFCVRLTRENFLVGSNIAEMLFLSQFIILRAMFFSVEVNTHALSERI